MSEFEKLPEISERIDGWIAFRNGRYWNKSTGYVDQYLTGAWYAYQEQQKRIDVVLQVLCELKESMDGFKEMDLYDKGYRVTTEYVIADLEQALRGEHD